MTASKIRFSKLRQSTKKKQVSSAEEDEGADTSERQYLTTAHFNRLFSFLTPDEVRETLTSEEQKRLEKEGVEFRESSTDASLQEAERKFCAEVKPNKKL